MRKNFVAYFTTVYKISILLRQSILEVYFGINKLTKTYLSLESNSVNVIIACAPLLPVPEKTFQYSVQGLQQLIYRKILTTKNFFCNDFHFQVYI